ncbi:hypothetical protein GOFOIKOB_4538 [Methylobacterium tardum]|uniref:Uncharacterized protein n=1 Tax=Methylobacterium tardum TaxID=374432 RepID=A0AA37TMG7_9HYPH|nr:hypothetical protein [Methylobacterium tardum]URD39440.1 hypothetical protein M6G65_14145 [Methylobacterium tardum]GJE51479.1 hypothetical protein GOFOIKOB_4538 [Methylobacterium tardum]GLS73624.1 hypothetical protein GCM10007890_56390 [Methylobacterium tardum]
MKLHYLRVRRVRGLAMPLPPMPKRPIGPPVLFAFRDVSIRTRADAVEASGSWEGFLFDMADIYTGDAVDLPSNFLQLVERLVPRAELQAHREEMGDLIRARQGANLRHLRQVLDEARRPKPGLVARLFGRAA